MNPSHPRRGFTLTEMAIVLGVVGIVLGGIWAASSSVNDKQKANKAAQEVAIITQNMRQYYSAKNSFPAGTLTASAMAAGLFPPDMIVNGVTVNPWGTVSAVAGSSGASEIPNLGVSVGSQAGYGNGSASVCPNYNAPNILQIVFWGLSGQDCLALLSQFVGPAVVPVA